MSSSVAATFAALDANHDGVIDMREFAGATAPVTTITQSAPTYTIRSSPPAHVSGPAYTIPASSSIFAGAAMPQMGSTIAAPQIFAADLNHDGRIQSNELFTAAPVVQAPVVQLSSPVTYPAAPVTIIGGSTSIPAATSMIAPAATSFVGTAGTLGATGHTLTLYKGARVVYTSKTTGEEYPATVVERNAAGWLIKLDIDGGVKEVVDSEMWRVKAEGSTSVVDTKPAAETPAVKSKKVKASKISSKKKKGGCCR